MEWYLSVCVYARVCVFLTQNGMIIKMAHLVTSAMNTSAETEKSLFDSEGRDKHALVENNESESKN